MFNRIKIPPLVLDDVLVSCNKEKLRLINGDTALGWYSVYIVSVRDGIPWCSGAQTSSCMANAPKNGDTTPSAIGRD